MAFHAGLDISAYPGDNVMQFLKGNTNLVWSGFYLGPAPSHRPKDWMTKRSTLVAMGWGLAPLYVGQQTVGKGSKHPDKARGLADGNDAVNLMKQAGFPPGSCVYLDLENGLPFPAKQRDYVVAWAENVEKGGFKAGVYCSHRLAGKVLAAVPGARIWVFKVPTTKKHPCPPGPNYPQKDPTAVFPQAVALQHQQNCVADVPPAPHGKLTIDLDSAVSANPGAP